MTRTALAFVFASSLLLVSCGNSDDGSCTPGTNRACACAMGVAGTQSCNSARVWGGCSCDTPLDGGGMDMSVMNDSGLPDAHLADANSVDSSVTHDELLASLGTLPVATITGGSATPDYSCRGTWDQSSTPTAPVDGVIAFDYGGALGTSFDVKVFPDNQIPNDLVCTSGCFTRVMDSGGITGSFTLYSNRFTAWASPSWIAGWGESYVPTANYFIVSDNFIPYNYRTIVPSIGEMQDLYDRNGHSYASGKSTLTGMVVDCQRRGVQHVAIRVIDELGLRDHTASPHMVYGSVNSANLSNGNTTIADARYVGIDAMPLSASGSEMRIEAWANLGSGTPELVACERVRVFANHVVDVPLAPFRASSPEDCLR